MTPQPELSRMVRIDALGSAPRIERVEADAGERAALARRFGLVAVDRLEASVTLTRDGDEVRAEGRLRGAVSQACAATDAPLAVTVDERFALLFVPAPAAGGDEEIELDDNALDVVFYEGGAIDIGEAAAQTLPLALDPFPRAPDADLALRAAGVGTEAENGPFAALAALKDKLTP